MPQSNRVAKRKPKANPSAHSQHAKATGEKVRGGIYTCPPIIRNVEHVSDAQLKRWAIAILDLIAAGVINYRWVTLARMLKSGRIVAVKLATQQQSLGLLHACARAGAEVLQRKFEEPGDGGKKTTVYCVVRADSVDQIPLGGVYGAGTTAARKLLKEGLVVITDEALAKRTAMATRKLIPNEYPKVYRQFSNEAGTEGGRRRRRRVLYVEKNDKGEFTLRLADRLKELLYRAGK